MSLPTTKSGWKLQVTVRTTTSSPCRAIPILTKASNDAWQVDFVFEYLPDEESNAEPDSLAPGARADQSPPGHAPPVLSPGSACSSGTVVHDVQSLSLSPPQPDESPRNIAPCHASLPTSTRSESSASYSPHSSQELSHPRDTGAPTARCWPVKDENEVLLLRHFVERLSLWVWIPHSSTHLAKTWPCVCN